MPGGAGVEEGEGERGEVPGGGVEGGWPRGVEEVGGWGETGGAGVVLGGAGVVLGGAGVEEA